MGYRIIDNDTTRCQEFVKSQTGWIGTDLSVCIGLERDGELVAVTGFNHYNEKSIHIHMVIKKGIRVTREYCWFIFYYPFVQLGCEMVIAMMAESNNVVGFSKNAGFVERYRIPEAHPDGSIILSVLEKKDCKFIGGRYAIR